MGFVPLNRIVAKYKILSQMRNELFFVGSFTLKYILSPLVLVIELFLALDYYSTYLIRKDT